MKYIFITLTFIFAFSIVSCDTSAKNEEGEHLDWDFEVIRHDGCQYIYGSATQRGYIAHKGNCDNPKHCENQ